jgi:hypothetical protein
MAVDFLAIALSFVENIDLFFIGKEHLLRKGAVRGVEEVMRRTLTIIAETKVSPFSTSEPGFCAATEEASPKASKERLEYMTGYSDAEN